MSNATEYADSLADTIREYPAEAPFGLIRRDTEEWTDDTEAFDDWQDNPDTEYIEASAGDYLGDCCIDVQYIVNSDRTYRAARVCVAIGGPTVWINTNTEQLEVAWWSATEYRDLPRAFCDGIDDYLAEVWEASA